MNKPNSLRILDEISSELLKARSPKIPGKESQRGKLLGSYGAGNIKNLQNYPEIRSSPFRVSQDISGETANFPSNSKSHPTLPPYTESHMAQGNLFSSSPINPMGERESSTHKRELNIPLDVYNSQGGSRNVRSGEHTLSLSGYPPGMLDVYSTLKSSDTSAVINLGRKSETLYFKITENIGSLMKTLEDRCNQIEERIEAVIKNGVEPGVKEGKFVYLNE